jgi:hypothetical protein
MNNLEAIAKLIRYYSLVMSLRLARDILPRLCPPRT